MGKSQEPTPVKLIMSMFAQDTALFDLARARLEGLFGPIDLVSEVLPFEQTDYYTPEFGPHLVRQFITFAQLIDPGRLAEIKIATNALEAEWAEDGQRRINLDPGYLSLGKLVLATTKDHAHRIYLGQGIYAEVTLAYRAKAFRPWPWTYPDYASESYRELFQRIRQNYLAQLKSRQDEAKPISHNEESASLRSQ